MKGNQYEEIFLVEDKSDLLGLSIKTLKDNGQTNICITRESENVFGVASQGEYCGKLGTILDMNFILIYTLPKHNKNADSELLKINSKLEVIPLLLIVGRTKDIDIITGKLIGAHRCFKESVNLRDFIEKIGRMPFYWGLIQTTTPNDMIYGKVENSTEFIKP